MPHGNAAFSPKKATLHFAHSTKYEGGTRAREKKTQFTAFDKDDNQRKRTWKKIPESEKSVRKCLPEALLLHERLNSLSISDTKKGSRHIHIDLEKGTTENISPRRLVHGCTEGARNMRACLAKGNRFGIM